MLRAIVVGCLIVGCNRSSTPDVGTTQVTSADVPAGAPAQEAPSEIKTIDVPGDSQAWFLAGKKGTHERLVFLHPKCTNGFGYLQAFQAVARERASTVALQGDEPCNGDARRWGWDIRKTDARIENAFAAAGDQRPLEHVVLVGYSQGASIAEALANKFPHHYDRLVLIGAPATPNIAKARAVVMVAGSLDNTLAMKEGERKAEANGVDSTFLELEGVRHGQMGDAETWMRQALDFLEVH